MIQEHPLVSFQHGEKDPATLLYRDDVFRLPIQSDDHKHNSDQESEGIGI